MTPQQRFDHKISWMRNATLVTIHSDNEHAAKRWCKRNAQQHQWHCVRYTDMYEHTFYFEQMHTAKAFEQEYGI
jgi:peroxiredoxin